MWMFVGAESLRVNVCGGVFTHYKREEDETMESGKLDEELARMSDIANHMTSTVPSLQRVVRGDQRARGLTDRAPGGDGAPGTGHQGAVRDTHVRSRRRLSPARLDTALFLRAERGSDGARPFKLRKASRCRPATARTPTGRSSARASRRREPTKAVPVPGRDRRELAAIFAGGVVGALLARRACTDARRRAPRDGRG